MEEGVILHLAEGGIVDIKSCIPPNLHFLHGFVQLVHKTVFHLGIYYLLDRGVLQYVALHHLVAIVAQLDEIGHDILVDVGRNRRGLLAQEICFCNDCKSFFTRSTCCPSKSFSFMSAA